MYGEGAVNDQTCQKWFVNFRAGGFLLNGAPWSDWPVKVDSNQIEILIENNQCYTTQEVANILKNIQINKVFGKNEKYVFYFMEKIIWTFWTTEYLW